MRNIDAAPRPVSPAGVTFAASLPDEGAHAQSMAAAGWTQTSDTEFGIELGDWTDSREPLAAAMSAAGASLIPYFAGLDLSSAAARASQDPERLRALEEAFVDWVTEREPEWISPDVS
jgi:hypothetical protein